MKKYCYAIFCLSFFQCNSFSQNSGAMPLWEKDIPNFQESNEKETEENGDILWIEKVQKPSLEIYLPTKRSATGLAVVVCPGGGYAGLAYDWEGTDIAKWLNSKGITAFVLKYRMPQAKSVTESHTTPMLDAQRAIRTVRYHAEKWNIQKDKVGVMGFSAGGHLASTLGTQFENKNPKSKDPIDRMSDRPDFMALIYPVISMDVACTHQGTRDDLLGKNASDELVKKYSNDLQVTSNTPPTFLIHSADDEVVPVENSLRFYKACIQQDVPVEMHLYPNGGHGFSLAIGQGHLEGWPDLFCEWLNK